MTWEAKVNLSIAEWNHFVNSFWDSTFDNTPRYILFKHSFCCNWTSNLRSSFPQIQVKWRSQHLWDSHWLQNLAHLTSEWWPTIAQMALRFPAYRPKHKRHSDCHTRTEKKYLSNVLNFHPNKTIFLPGDFPLQLENWLVDLCTLPTALSSLTLLDSVLYFTLLPHRHSHVEEAHWHSTT